MASTGQTSSTVKSINKLSVPEFPRPISTEIKPKYEKRADELTHEQAFDQDFDNLKENADQLAQSPQVTTTADGFELDIKGNFIDSIIVRKIPQDLRFDADPKKIIEDRFEVAITFMGNGSDMADQLIVSLEELYVKPLDAHVATIKQRLIEAHRVSTNTERDHRVQAMHREKVLENGNVEHEVKSQGDGVKRPMGYDSLIELEVKTAIDAIKSTMALLASENQVREFINTK